MEGVGARGGGEQALHTAGARAWDKLLRHGGHVLAGRKRGDPRPRAQGLRAGPRPRCHRHQGVQRHGRRPESARPVAQAHPPRHRRQPQAPRHRLRRPVPDPPVRPVDAGRGDDGGARRPRARRQGAPPRRVVDVGLAVRQDATRSRLARLGAVRHDAEPLQPHLPRGGAGDDPALRRQVDRPAAVEPPCARIPGARRRRRHGPRRGPTSTRATSTADVLSGSDLAVHAAVGKVASARGVPRAQVALAWVCQRPGVVAPDRRRLEGPPPRGRRRRTFAEAQPRRRWRLSRRPTSPTPWPATNEPRRCRCEDGAPGCGVARGRPAARRNRVRLRRSKRGREAGARRAGPAGRRGVQRRRRGPDRRSRCLHASRIGRGRRRSSSSPGAGGRRWTARTCPCSMRCRGPARPTTSRSSARTSRTTCERSSSRIRSPPPPRRSTTCPGGSWSASAAGPSSPSA